MMRRRKAGDLHVADVDVALEGTLILEAALDKTLVTSSNGPIFVRSCNFLHSFCFYVLVLSLLTFQQHSEQRDRSTHDQQ